MRDSITEASVSHSLSDSPPSRAPADQGSRDLGNEGSGKISNSPSTPPSSTSTRTTRHDVDGWQPGDVVVLDTGEIYGLMAADVLNPWVLLNDDREDGDNFDETGYIEDHAPELLARAGRIVLPVVGSGLSGPVESGEVR